MKMKERKKGLAPRTFRLASFRGGQPASSIKMISPSSDLHSMKERTCIAVELDLDRTY